MLTNKIKINKKLKYVCLSKEQTAEWVKNNTNISQKPKCYSCEDSTYIIPSWYAIDEDGNKVYTCAMCLDAYTDVAVGSDLWDVDIENDLDFTSKRVLKNFRVIVCEDCGRSSVSACRHSKKCISCGTCHTAINQNKEDK